MKEQLEVCCHTQIVDVVTTNTCQTKIVQQNLIRYNVYLRSKDIKIPSTKSWHWGDLRIQQPLGLKSQKDIMSDP